MLIAVYIFKYSFIILFNICNKALKYYLGAEVKIGGTIVVIIDPDPDHHAVIEEGKLTKVYKFIILKLSKNHFEMFISECGVFCFILKFIFPLRHRTRSRSPRYVSLFILLSGNIFINFTVLELKLLYYRKIIYFNLIMNQSLNIK